jgi:NAD+ kinase
MKRLGVIANCTKPRSAAVLGRLAEIAKALGAELLAMEPEAGLIGCRASASAAAMFERAEAVIALGGDGTMLRAVRLLDGRDTPVLGVNIGGLGFLTSVSEEEMDAALRCLACDRYVLQMMAVAECGVERGDGRRSAFRALNDVVVSRGPSGRVITLRLTVDGQHVTSYVCDGLIVATPAGSTGHSLSAGGPILVPETPAFVISLICPHTLSSRPLVVPDRSEICVTGEGPAEQRMLLSVDGQTDEELAAGDRVTVRRSPRGVRFIRLPGHSVFAVLRQKLRWSGSSVDADAGRTARSG